jgi:hypothetical protein
MMPIVSIVVFDVVANGGRPNVRCQLGSRFASQWMLGEELQLGVDLVQETAA